MKSVRKEARKKEIKLRKNFLPTLIITILLFSLTGLLVYFVEPDSPGALPLFFVLVFLAFLFFFSLLFANTRRGVLISFGLTLFLLLRYFGIGNVLNLLLILGILVTLEVYFLRRS